MSHIRESFPVLEDFATQEGAVLSKMNQGDAPSTKNGLMGFAFKDSAGNVVLPTLTPEGKVPVDLQGAGVPKSATSDGEVAGALTETLVCEVALTVNKTYGHLKASGACFKETIFYVYQQNDAVNTKIGHFIVGPGQYSWTWEGGQKEIVAGASGTQKLQLKAMNLVKESDFLGDVACIEFAV